MKLYLIGLIILLFNIPFGYWRANSNKLSKQWVLAVHLPVPFVIALRIFSGLGWKFITFPVLVGSFFLGQLIGGILHRRMENDMSDSLSSCLIWDLVKIDRNH